MWLTTTCLILLCSLMCPLLVTVFMLGCLWHKAQKKQRQFNLKNLPAIEDEHPDAEAAARNDHNRRQKPLPKFQIQNKPAPTVVHTADDLDKAKAEAGMMIAMKPTKSSDLAAGQNKKNIIRFAGTGHLYFVPETDQCRGAICDDVESDRSADTYGTNTQSSSSSASSAGPKPLKT